ncbi:hypothetical protein G7Y89_g11843 [Cudoniella acicularis]|uniref:Uncharacterized protein n=1 Tax=Cudoniella acicularis TaxID=354080 RepID=A0A8H4RCQ7_9HELO|nr:hypothetical protein G7Y89_g11843 [Cudoniella acicularis]
MDDQDATAPPAPRRIPRTRKRLPLAMSEEVNKKFIFPNADLMLLATYEKRPVKGKVSSVAMSLASPVWQKFIFPPFVPFQDVDKPKDERNTEIEEEQDDNGQAGLRPHPPADPPADRPKQLRLSNGGYMVQELDFREDNGAALLVLHQIAHLQFRNIPFRLPDRFGCPSYIFNKLASMCDLYDCASLVKPWVENWVVAAQDGPRSADHVAWSCCHTVDNGKWLFIDWVFGREQSFEEGAKCAVRKIYVRRYLDGTLRYKIGSRNFPKLAPPGLLENLLKHRLRDIKALLDIVYAHEKRITEGVKEEFGWSQPIVCNHYNRSCEAIIYGSLVLELTSLKLWPAIIEHEYSESVEELAESLQNMTIHHIGPTKDLFDGKIETHENCGGINIREQVQEYMVKQADPVLPHHREHMRIQRERFEPAK